MDAIKDTHLLVHNLDDYLAKKPLRDYFINLQKQIIVENQLSAKDSLLFMPTDVMEYFGDRLLLTGCLLSGAKASVLLTNVPHFFDVFPGKLLNKTEIYTETVFDKDIKLLIGTSKEFAEFIGYVNNIKLRFEVQSVEYIRKKIYNIGKEYHIGVRFYFRSPKERSKTLTECLQHPPLFVTSNYTSVSNSAFIYHNIYSGYWMTINNYICNTYDPKDRTFGKYQTKAKYNFTCNFHEFKKSENEKDLKLFLGHNLIMTWDIETCEVKDDNEIKEKYAGGIINPENQVFNIGIVISDTSQDKKELLRIGIFRPCVEKYIKLDNKDFDIMCRTQTEVIMAFAKIIASFQPDFMVTYNGNGFDIPIILLQARLCKIFDQFYCMTSILTSDTIEGKSYNSKYGCYYTKNGQYTFWSKINTTFAVSGIPDGNSHPRSHQSLKEFKLEAELSEKYHYWTPPGCVNIDLLMTAKKAFPKEASKSLSNILKKKKVPQTKDDLPYSEIWLRWKDSYRYFDTPTKEQLQLLTEIDTYCKQDCWCTYLLLCSFMLIAEKRAMCQYTSLSITTNIYQADGIKVVSGVGRLCSTQNYVYIERFLEAKYLRYDCTHLRYHLIPTKYHNQGAIVEIYRTGKIYHYHEKYGNVIMPLEANDAASLYPNCDIAKNLSPENFVFSRPANIDDYEELYLPDLPDGIIQEFGIQNKTVWVYMHKNNPSRYGILPTYLVALFNDRKKIKAEMFAKMIQQEEMMEHFKKLYPKDQFLVQNNYLNLTKIQQDSAYDKYMNANIGTRYHELSEEILTLNAYQLVVKIKMNTVYGCAKYENNILYCYLIAHVITKFGRETITEANRITVSLGGTLCYNDTDSVYFYHAIEKFADILDSGVTGEALEKKMVHRSMKLTFGRARLIEWYSDKYFKLIGQKPRRVTYDELLELTVGYKFHSKVVNLPAKGFNDILNGALKEFSGGDRIEFMREETLYPAVFLTKKKYFGRKHEWSYVPEITLATLLSKGVSSVARNTTDILRTFNNSIMLEILVSKEIDCEKIVFDRVKELYLTTNDPKKFVKNYVYKPNVQNILVQSFVKRMKKLHSADPELYRLPNPLEIIGLILTKPDYYYNLNGNNKKHAKSDNSEYLSVVQKQGLKIDKEHYLASMYSTCAQMLTYKKYEFYEEGLSIKEYKKRIQAKRVVPYFKEYINSQPEIAKLNAILVQLKTNFKIGRNTMRLYFLQKYPTIADLLDMFLLHKEGQPFDTIKDYCISLTKETITTNLTLAQFRQLNRTKGVIPNVDQIRHLMETEIEVYREFINLMYYRAESAFHEYFKIYPDSDANLNNLYTEHEVHIMSTYRYLLLYYIAIYQYRLSYTISEVFIY